MMRRFLLTASVLLLFVSGWSQVLAASLCSHTPGAHACCRTKEASHAHEQASSHQGMAMDGIESMEMPSGEAAPAGNESVISFGQPLEACAHCLGHSQSQTVPVNSITSDQSGRGNETLAPPVPVEATPLASAFATSITSRQHAPPGAMTARHVLISVFRI
jgi:hypothetical protein